MLGNLGQQTFGAGPSSLLCRRSDFSLSRRALVMPTVELTSISAAMA